MSSIADGNTTPAAGSRGVRATAGEDATPSIAVIDKVAAAVTAATLVSFVANRDVRRTGQLPSRLTVTVNVPAP